MKRVIFAAIIVGFFSLTKVSAQQEPYYTHFMFNTLNYNAAYAGTRDGVCASVLYHNQWTGFKDSYGEGGVSPLTQTVSIHSPLYAVGVKNETSPFAGHMGIGANIINDKSGFIGGTGVNVAASYMFSHLWSKVKYVSVGLNIGMMQQSIDGDHWKVPQPNDPRIPGTTSSSTLDAGFGIYLSALNWYAGVSSTHINKGKVNWETDKGTSEFPISSAYYLTGGYMRPISAKWELQGYGMLESDMVKSSVAVSALGLYQKMVYGGLSVRKEKLTAVSVLAGVYPKINKGSLLIGLGWDIPTGYSKYFGGSPEIFARYCFSISIPTVEPIWYKSGRWL